MTTPAQTQPLELLTWPGMHAGFHAQPPVATGAGSPAGPLLDPTTWLLHAGETWAGASYRIGRHAHPGWEVYLQAHGTTRWRVAGVDVTMAAGAALAVPPQVGHELAEPPSARHHFFYAALDVQRLAAAAGSPALALGPWTSQEPLHRLHGEALTAPFRALVRELAGVRPLQREGLRAAAALLLVEATRVFQPAGDPAAVPVAVPSAGPHAPAVRRALALLDERFGERWRLVDLARGSGVSAGHLADLFARDVGIAPHRYLHQRRLVRAAELLAGSDLPITTIALEVGFGSGPHLSRAFRAARQCSPREYRRRHRPG